MLLRHRDVDRGVLVAAAGRLGPAPVLALFTAVLALTLLRLDPPPSTAQGEDPSLGPDRPPALLGLYGGEVTALHREGQRLYAGIGGRLAVFAIGEDQGLRLLGQSGALSERIHAIATDQGHAYLAAGSAGMLALDLADESAPRLVGRVATPGESGQPGSAVDLAIEDHRAYVATNAALRVVDLTEPGAPVELGSLAIGATAVVSWQGHAYVLSGGGLAVVDASRPDRPRLTTWLRPSEGSDWTALTLSEGWLLVAGSELQTFALTQPGRPRSTSRLSLGRPYQHIARLASSGSRLLIVVSRDDGLKLMVVDRSDPAVPREERLLSRPGVLRDLIAGTAPDRWLAARVDTGLVELDLSDHEASEARQIERVPSFGIERAAISGNVAVAVGAGSTRTAVIDLQDASSWPLRSGPVISQTVSQVAFHGDTAYLAGYWGLERHHLDRETTKLERRDILGNLRFDAIQVRGDRAYTLSSDQTEEFRIFDLADQAMPRLLGSLDLPSGVDRSIPVFLQLGGDHAYAVTDAGKGLMVIDVAVPSTPRLLGSGAALGSYPGPISPSTANGLAVSGDRAAVGLDRFGISWMDVSRPRAPRQVAFINLALPELGQAANAYQPAFVGRHVLTSYLVPTWPNMISGLAWVTSDASGKPAAVSNFWTQPQPSIMDFGRSGAHLLLADSQRGLAVWRLDQTSPPTATPPVRPTASQQPQPTDAARPHQAYLPVLSRPAPKPPAGDAERLREVAVLGGRPEAIAIAGNLLYLGVGNSIETYDISVPGQARRLASSAPVEGRIVRLALGSDRLFALSRSALNWQEPPPPDLTPPWTLLSVFDISDPAAPRLLGKTTPIVGREKDIALDNLFATDLAAHGRTAYLPVFSRPDQFSEHWQSFYGIAIVDASSTPLRYSFDPDLVGRGFRPLVHDGRLYIKGDLPADRAEALGFRQGVMGFDLVNSLAPRWLGAAGSLRLDDSTTVFDLVGQERRLFGVDDRGALVPVAIQEDGRPELTGDWLGDDGLWERMDLGLDLWGMVRSAAAPGRVYLLLPMEDGTPVAGIDVRDPMHPQRLPWFGIGGLDLRHGQFEMENRDMKPDLGADLAATTDGRLFLASGYDGVLVELDVRDPENQHELARYSAGIRSDCSLIADGHLIQADLSNGTLSLRSLADPSQLPLVGSTTVSLGSSCALAKAAADGRWLYVAGSDGLTVVDLQDPTAPRPRGSLTLGGEPRQMVVENRQLYLAAGNEGLWTVDVSDPDAPKLLGHLATPGFSHGLATDGNRLYLADGPAGLTVVDVSDPAAPREVEALLPGEEIVAIARRGDWFYAGGVHRSRPGAGIGLAELVTLQRDGPLRVRSRWPLDAGSEGILALDGVTGTDLYVQDGPGGVRWMDLSAGLPQSRDLWASEVQLTGLVAGDGWVLSGGESQRLLRRDTP